MHEDLLHFLFFTCADEQDTMSIEDFLKQTIVCVNPAKHTKYLKQITKVVDLFEKEGITSRVSLSEFLAFQFFLDDIDVIKRKVAQLKSIDFDMFEEIFQDYAKYKSKKNAKKEKETEISATLIKALFLMLDVDESGELEEEEVMDVLQPRQHLGQNRD